MEKKRIAFTFVITAAVLAVIFFPGYSHLEKRREENRQLAERIKLLEENNSKLDAELKKLRGDPEYVEKKAREKLGVVKKGEVLYKSSSGKK